MSQKLNIPNLGTVLILTEDWEFNLYFEDRNQSLLDDYGYIKKFRWREEKKLKPADFKSGKIPQEVEYEDALTEEQLKVAYKSYRATNAFDNPFIKITLPTGTQLSVERIYIRKGAEAFNSVTFRTTKNCPDLKYRNKRFWVKLRDANKIVADII